MRKLVSVILVLVLCLSLCACGGGEENIELPTESQPDVTEAQDTDSGEGTANSESTEETTLWEAEFIEEDYDVFHFPGQTSYRQGGLFGFEARVVREEPDGTIEDCYNYPSNYPYKIISQRPDGNIFEAWLLDNGYEEGNTKYSGTMIYQKQITPEGTVYETFFDEDGKKTRATCANTDGTYRDTYYKNGVTVRDISDSPSTGEHSETEFYESGAVKRAIGTNSRTGMYSEQEYYENGGFMLSKNKSPESAFEEHFDEEGYRTHYYYKDTNYEIELTADETGKLVKIVENGEVKDDVATLAQYASNYNFRQ